MLQLKETFISLVTAAYIQQAAVAELKEGSDVPTLVPVATIVPDLDTRTLLQAASTFKHVDTDSKEIYKCSPLGFLLCRVYNYDM